MSELIRGSYELTTMFYTNRHILYLLTLLYFNSCMCLMWEPLRISSTGTGLTGSSCHSANSSTALNVTLNHWPPTNKNHLLMLSFLHLLSESAACLTNHENIIPVDFPEFPVDNLSTHFNTFYTVDATFPVNVTEKLHQHPSLQGITCNKRHSTMKFPGDLAKFQ